MFEFRDLRSPAIAVYFGETGPTPDGTMRLRFPTTADAVRYVIERLTVKEQVTASLVFEDGDFCRVEGIIALHRRMQHKKTHTGLRGES